MCETSSCFPFGTRHVSLLQVIQLDAPSDPRDVLELTRLSVQTISGGQRSLTSRVDCRKCMKAHYSCHIQTEWTRTSRRNICEIPTECWIKIQNDTESCLAGAANLACAVSRREMMDVYETVLFALQNRNFHNFLFLLTETQKPTSQVFCSWYFTACKTDRPFNFWSWPSWQLSRQKGREPPLDDYLSVGHGYLWCRRTCSHIWTINSFLACVIQSFPFWRPSASSGKHAVAFLFNMFFLHPFQSFQMWTSPGWCLKTSVMSRSPKGSSGSSLDPVWCTVLRDGATKATNSATAPVAAHVWKALGGATLTCNSHQFAAMSTEWSNMIWCINVMSTSIAYSI